nr:DUF998 domain-containing protein [Candidatus Njordarchaeota archaeon]
MKWNPLKWPILCTSGILIIVFYCFFTFTSWALYPSPYGPTTHYLSTLGDRVDSPGGAIVYNAGCILTGIAAFAFYIGLYRWYTGETWRRILLIVSQLIGLCSAVALVMIGVFPGDTGAPHMLASSVFFLLNFMCLILVNISLMTHPKFMKPVGFYGLTIAILSLIFDFAIGGPIIEWFTVFGSLGYAGLLTYNTFKIQSR